MSDLKDLEARLDAALARLAAAPPAAGPDPDALSALEARNTELSQKLAALSAQRDKDLAQLDELLAQLRPLIDEAV